jgi:hypothetical protein
MLNLNSRTAGVRRGLLACVVLGANLFLSNLLFPTILSAQSTPGTGGIRGIVVDQNGAAVVGAKVTITSKITAAAVIHTTTSSEGLYSSGPLQPGEYAVRVEAKGFRKSDLNLLAHVAEVTAGNFKLQPGPEIALAAAAPAEGTRANTEQPTVQSTMIASQAEALPISGRNYIDFAQFTPDVQLQDGGILHPGKDGFSSISFDSGYGRATRIEVDGVSISDATVGATTQNIPASAIQEFNLSQSSLDLPAESISTGVVNIATRSGSNNIHGEGFGVYRGDQGAASLPGSVPQSFQREQFGARVGGPLVKDKFFWFLDGERTMQNLNAQENFAAPFNTLGLTLSQPFREFQADGRLDWQRRADAHGFYRFTFDQVGQVRPSNTTSLQALGVATHTPSHTFGYDFTRGAYTHSIRFEYLRMSTGIGDHTATLPAEENPIPGLGINVGAPVGGNCGFSGGGAFCGGPSQFAAQAMLQSNLNFRYDGSRLLGSHLFRFGVAFNRIHAGGFADQFLDPQAGETGVCLPGSTITNCLTSTDPTAYPADFVFLGNGLGFSTTNSAFGYSGGGLGADNQLEAYVGDGWKYHHNLTLTYGVRYLLDHGNIDNSLGPLPVLNEWMPGLSNAVRQPKLDFGPQFGFAWDVGGTGKTVIRGGSGLYYDTSLLSNQMLDSRARTAKGTIAYTPQVCDFGNPAPFIWPSSLAGLPVNSSIAGGTAVVVNPTANQAAPTFCGAPISTAGSQIQALNSAFQVATAANGASQANPNYVATALSAVNANGVDIYNPNYLTPRSLQMNLGFQQEISPGTVVSVDYVRSIGTHNPLIVDANHSGAARSYNYANAVAARNAVQASVGCPLFPGEAQCVINNLGSVAAAQAAYSVAGLDSNSATTNGAPCSFCAFPGVTPFGINNNGAGGGTGSLGTLDMLSTVGRSLYAGWQGRLVQRFVDPVHGIKSANLQIAYTFSKYTSQAQDLNFPAVATDNDNPTSYKGPNGLDRKHQFSLGGTFDLPVRLKLSLVAHIYSPLAQTLEMPELTNGGEIYATDWLGSGLTSGGAPEPLPGTQIGQFMRGTNLGQLPNVISNYNTHFAGTLTPAGHCLVADASCPGGAPISVMTNADMAALGWVMPTIPSPTYDPQSPPWLKTLDLRLAWPVNIGERITVEPSASVFNVINFANSFLPGDLPSGSLIPGPNPTLVPNGVLAPSAVGGAIGSTLAPFRAGYQSGTYAVGAPRVIEFSLRISF